MEMTYDTFLDSICRRGGIESAEEAERVTGAVLEVLGEALVDSDRAALAEVLPANLRESLCARTPNQDYDLATFYAKIGELNGFAAQGAHAGRGREMAQVVGQTLTRALDAALNKRLRRRLPDDFQEVFVNPHQQVGEPQTNFDHRARAKERTLSRGKPGSEHPVSESRPVEGQPGSIAAQPEPHHDTDIATGHESVDEDENTLAGGRPGSERPLSETHEE